MYDVSFKIDFRRNKSKGKFFVIEGIDGSGKTTQIKRVVQSLQQKNIDAVETKEPTDGPIGQMIRDVLRRKTTVSFAGFQYLFTADRAEHEEQIVKLLEEGKTVIGDRYFWSSVAYGFTDNRERSDYNLASLSLLSFYNQFLVPDITFFLDVPIDLALERLKQSRGLHEIYERKERQEKIKEGYDWLLAKFPKEFVIIDGNQSEEEITEEILAKII